MDTLSTAIQQPIFLVGAERSGTTLLRLLLDHHPSIAFQKEFEFAVDSLGPNGQHPDVAQYRKALQLNFVFQGSDFTIDESLEFLPLVNSFLIQKKADKSLVGATIHRHFDRITKLWPDARFIYLIRDGRDVARSTMGMGWAGNIYLGAGGWIEAVHAWERMKPTIPEDRRIEVRYENLVSDVEPELRKVCSWIGVEYDEAMFDYTKTTKYKSPNPSLANQWQHKLSPEDLQLVEARIADLLLANGYPLSGQPRITISPAEERRIFWQDRVARFRWRMRTHGPVLTLMETASRRLGLDGLNEQIKQRIYSIDHRRFASKVTHDRT